MLFNALKLFEQTKRYLIYSFESLPVDSQSQSTNSQRIPKEFALQFSTFFFVFSFKTWVINGCNQFLFTLNDQEYNFAFGTAFERFKKD